MHNYYFILAKPQLGENIGLSARAMANFGFSNLRIIKPRDGWPNLKANKNAAHGEFVVSQAEIFKNTKEAIGNLHVLFALSARKRDLKLKTFSIFELSRFLQKIPQAANVGFMFGQENNGLANDDLKCADYCINIETDALCPSMNLAMSVAVVSFQLSQFSYIFRHLHKPSKLKNNGNLPIRDLSRKADKATVDNFLQRLIFMLEKKHYFPSIKHKNIMINNLYAMFNRLDLSVEEVNSLHGIIKTLYK